PAHTSRGRSDPGRRHAFGGAARTKQGTTVTRGRALTGPPAARKEKPLRWDFRAEERLVIPRTARKMPALVEVLPIRRLAHKMGGTVSPSCGNARPFPLRLHGGLMPGSANACNELNDLLEEFRAYLETLTFIHVDPR